MRRDVREEGGNGGCLAAVMADLEQVGGEIARRKRKHGGFAGCLGIAFEQRGVAGVAEVEDERVVVGGGVAGLISRCR